MPTHRLDRLSKFAALFAFVTFANLSLCRADPPGNAAIQDQVVMQVPPSSAIQGLLFNPAGTVLRGAIDDPDCQGFQWDAATGKLLNSHSHQSLHDVYSPDGKWLFAAGSGLSDFLNPWHPMPAYSIEQADLFSLPSR